MRKITGQPSPFLYQRYLAFAALFSFFMFAPEGIMEGMSRWGGDMAEV